MRLREGAAQNSNRAHYSAMRQGRDLSAGVGSLTFEFWRGRGPLDVKLRSNGRLVPPAAPTAPAAAFAHAVFARARL